MATATRTASPVVQDLCEQSLNNSSLQVDREQGVIRDVKICGRRSRNGRHYSDQALQQVMQEAEGSRVYVDHDSPQEGVVHRRSLRDRFGVLKGTYMRDDGVYARELRYNPEQSLTEQVLWEAENNPGTFGLSINVRRARLRKTKEGDVVESFEKLRSVDIVSEPATTNGLFESVETDDMTLANVTLDQLKAERPDLLESLQASLSQQDEVTTIKAQLQEALSLVESFKTKEAAAAKRAQILEKLKAAQLDPDDKRHVSDVFLKSLQEAADDAALQSLIDDRKALVAGLPPEKTSAKPGPTAAPALPAASTLTAKQAVNRWARR